MRLLHKKREAPLINGYNDTFTDSTDCSLLGCSLINAISPTIPPAGTLSK